MSWPCIFLGPGSDQEAKLKILHYEQSSVYINRKDPSVALGWSVSPSSSSSPSSIFYPLFSSLLGRAHLFHSLNRNILLTSGSVWDSNCYDCTSLLQIPAIQYSPYIVQLFSKQPQKQVSWAPLSYSFVIFCLLSFGPW